MQLVKIKLKTIVELISIKQRQWYQQFLSNKTYLTNDSLITLRKLLSETIQLLVVLLNKKTLESQKYPLLKYQSESKNSNFSLSRPIQEFKLMLSTLESIRERIVIQNNMTLANLRQIKDQIFKLIGYGGFTSFQRTKTNSFSGLKTNTQDQIGQKRPSIISQEQNKRKLKRQLERQMINFLSNKPNQALKEKSLHKQIEPAYSPIGEVGTIKKRKEKRFNYLQECERQIREEQMMKTPLKNIVRQLPSTNHNSGQQDPLGDELFDFVHVPLGAQSKLDFERLIINDSLQAEEIVDDDSLEIMKKEEEKIQNTGYFGEKILDQEERQDFSFCTSL